jgi:hypothetical protein
VQPLVRRKSQTMTTALFAGPIRDPKVILALVGICVFFYVLGKLWPVKRPPDD